MKSASTAAACVVLAIVHAGCVGLCTGLSGDGSDPDGIPNDTSDGSDADESGSSPEDDGGAGPPSHQI